MDKLEKVIQALENCTAEIKCRDCPWDECEGQHEHVELPKGLALKTLELLKAQEPRVMTLVELWHMEHKPVYLERKNSRLYMVEPAIVLKAERCYIPSLGDSYILMRENKIHDKYWACGYNVTWRCWNARPTDEQTEATPWN